MIDKKGKRTAKKQPSAIPPHISEDFTPAQKKAFGLTGKRAASKGTAKKRSAKKVATTTPTRDTAKEPRPPRAKRVKAPAETVSTSE